MGRKEVRIGATTNVDSKYGSHIRSSNGGVRVSIGD